MKFKLIFILLFLFNNVQSQNFPLTIKVVSSDSSQVIQGAIVFIDELHFNDTETDEYGIAYFESVPKGRITLNIRKPGFIPRKIDFNVTEKIKNNTLFIELNRIKPTIQDSQMQPPVSIENGGNSKSIISIDQKGGITAETVNINPPKIQRKITPQLRTQLDSILVNENVQIQIGSIMGNQEARIFAEEIAQYLISKGFDPGPVGEFTHNPPIIGQVLKERAKGDYLIFIGYLE